MLVVKGDGSWSTSKAEVSTMLVDFFTGFMGTASSSGPIDLDVLRAGPLIGTDFQTSLAVPVSDEEIRWVLFDIGDEQAPGPDGFTSAFFKANWDTVRGDVIGLSIITKILAKCMEALLPILIDRSPGEFVRGRSLVDDVFLAQEIVRGYSATRTFARCMLMVDLRKAYDTVSWEFLGTVLRGLDFPETFVGWVMECVTTA
ncbi:hypothetical protein LIER_42998 [Lithospermum erythrorhizon]|uniref:Reverse transcriptase domain-containing protein n=1 Tax=Lithospermum erythrorhizon TaxID=34254 RepID=A0AAV3PAJ0_LITER